MMHASLKKSWKLIIQALNAIEEDVSQKPATRSEAAALPRYLERLETAFMTAFGVIPSTGSLP